MGALKEREREGAGGAVGLELAGIPLVASCRALSCISLFRGRYGSRNAPRTPHEAERYT